MTFMNAFKDDGFCRSKIKDYQMLGCLVQVLCLEEEKFQLEEWA